MQVTLQYQYEPRDFRQFYRLMRPTARLTLLINAGHLLLGMLPSLVLLSTGGDGWLAWLFLGAGLAGLLGGRWIGLRRMRRQFEAHCLPREARLTDDYVELEWELGWTRFSWWWLAEAHLDRGWIVLRRSPRRALVALIPPRAVPDEDRERLLAELREKIREGRREFPRRDPGGEPLEEVAFRLQPSEIAQVAERIFLPRRRSVTGAVTTAALTLVVGGLLLLSEDPQIVGLVRMILAAVLILAGLAALAPLKRRLFGRLLGDPSLAEPQTVAVRHTGIEYRNAQMQSLARWSQVAGLLDARRFLVVLTSHGSLVCVPRRALAPGQDDRFLQRATEQLQQYAESRLPPPGASERIDSGNPYQPPTES